jgi:hypothetical protein
MSNGGAPSEVIQGKSGGLPRRGGGSPVKRLSFLSIQKPLLKTCGFLFQENERKRSFDLAKKGKERKGTIYPKGGEV